MLPVIICFMQKKLSKKEEVSHFFFYIHFLNIQHTNIFRGFNELENIYVHVLNVDVHKVINILTKRVRMYHSNK